MGWMRNAETAFRPGQCVLQRIPAVLTSIHFQSKTMQEDDTLRWLPRLAARGGPRFLQIADALQGAVADGLLKPPSPVLTTRPGAAICLKGVVPGVPMWRPPRLN